MARHGDTRSPSPVGSTYSSSRRSRRDEDRYEKSRRDDGRRYRRYRSPEVSQSTGIIFLLPTVLLNPPNTFRPRGDTVTVNVIETATHIEGVTAR